jgi:hypothetical protein
MPESGLVELDRLAETDTVAAACYLVAHKAEVLGDWLFRHYGNHQRAAVVADWFERGEIPELGRLALGSVDFDVDDLRALLPELWVGWNIHQTSGLSTKEWFRLFKAAGFVTDGPARPAEPITIYRGADYTRVRQLAWTTDLDTAAWFAWIICERREQWGTDLAAEPWFAPAVWEATVEPRHVLAMFNERLEHEIVVSPYCPPLRRHRVTRHPWGPAFESGAQRVSAHIAAHNLEIGA